MDRAFRWQQRLNRRPNQPDFYLDDSQHSAPLHAAVSPSDLSPYQSLSGENVSDYLDAVKSTFECQELLELWNDLWFGNAFEQLSYDNLNEPWNGARNNASYQTAHCKGDDALKFTFSSPVENPSTPQFHHAERSPVVAEAQRMPEKFSEDAELLPSHKDSFSVTAATTSAGIGTWANRQYFLLLPEQNVSEQACTRVNTVPTNIQQQHAECSDFMDDDAVAAAAWRWRFTRKWQAEQQRALDPGCASDADKNEEALQYLNAVGPAWDLHLPRTQSTDLTLGSHKSGVLSWAGTFGPASGLASELLLDDSYNGKKHPLSYALKDNATADMTKVAKRANQLLMQQSTLERQAQERWAELAGSNTENLWVGELLSVVEIDDWGVFSFVVARVARQEKQKILLRGKNYCSEAQLVEAINHEIVCMAHERDLPVESCKVIGGGTMEWRRDRDRHLHIHSGYVNTTVMPKQSTMHAADLLKLAGALAKQSLPMHYKVNVEGYKAL